MKAVADVMAAARFAAVSNLRSWPARVGAAAFVGIAGLGQVLARTAEPAPQDDRLFGYAFLIGAVFLLRSGLAEQRKGGFDLFLRHNLLTGGRQTLAHALALVLQLLLYALVCFLAGAVLSLGDLAFAAWYTAVLGLAVALVLPLVLLVEAVADFRLPLVVVAILAAVALMAGMAVRGPEETLMLLGLRVTRYDPASLVPLLLRVGIILPVGFGVIAAAVAWRDRVRGIAPRTT